ncbi:uncharacterized protein PG986_003393 [Apiospora aurea]|uniref:Uncharacterized protein n=1 Tax=Apiospora aurea TaxID=335848 RepID=A0ABR1QRK2_9PEZI
MEYSPSSIVSFSQAGSRFAPRDFQHITGEPVSLMKAPSMFPLFPVRPSLIGGTGSNMTLVTF